MFWCEEGGGVVGVVNVEVGLEESRFGRWEDVGMEKGDDMFAVVIPRQM